MLQETEEVWFLGSRTWWNLSSKTIHMVKEFIKTFLNNRSRQLFNKVQTPLSKSSFRKVQASKTNSCPIRVTVSSKWSQATKFRANSLIIELQAIQEANTFQNLASQVLLRPRSETTKASSTVKMLRAKTKARTNPQTSTLPTILISNRCKTNSAKWGKPP